MLVLTTFALDEYVFEALRAGASGFLLKDAPAEELAAAIRTVAAGDALLDAGRHPRRHRRVRPPRPGAALPAATRRLEQLTPRELEVLGLLARGRSNQDIATTLFVSEGTTKTHVSNVLPSSTCATASRPSSSPTRTASWWPATRAEDPSRG